MSALPLYEPASGAGLAVLGAATGAPAGAGAGVAALAGVAGAESAASTVRITLPMETLSPTLTLISVTTPAWVEGTSMVALSLSSETRESSFLMVSPALTRISMTGISAKSPISGTLTSMRFAMSLPLQNQLADIGHETRQIGGEARAGGAVDDAMVIVQLHRQEQATVVVLADHNRVYRMARNSQELCLRAN